MRSKVTVVLLFLNVVLFFYIFKFEEKWRAERATLEARRRVLPPEIASLDSFTRIAATGETVRLEKRADGWWLTKPYEWPANANAVSRIHNELQFLEHETSFAVEDLAKSGQSLADYGLANPALTLELGAAGRTYRLLIGDDTKTGNRLYVLSPDGKRIHVVNRSLAESVGLPLADLRSESVFTVPVFEVRSLNLQTAAAANLKVRLRRDAAGRWNFESPILARASKSAVEVTINALNGLTAKSFPTGVAADRTGLDTPALRVTLEGNARRETLLIGNSVAEPAAPGGTAEYYARFEDKSVVFTTAIEPALLSVLRTAQETLRDPHVLDFDPATVTALTIAAPGQPEISLQKLESSAPDSGNWQVVTRPQGSAPVTMAADPGIVEDLLRKLQQLSVREERQPDGRIVRKYLSDAPSAADLERYGFNRPEREITLALGTGGGPRGTEPSTLVLQIGISPDEPGKAFARLTNPPFVYEIVPDLLADAPALARHYRKRQLRELPAGALITSFSLVDLATNTPIQALKMKDGEKNWDSAVASEPESLRKPVVTLLTQLHSLRAAAFTAEAFSPDHADTPEGARPWKYRLDYTILFNGGASAQETPASLFLTERLGGSTLVAGTADFGGVVFTVTQEMLDALFALTYTARQDPGPAPGAPPTRPAGP
jgi:hypothetical protein